MIPKKSEKEQAILLRRSGMSYREILARIPVAKSSLSLWLHSVHLAKHQKQTLTAKKLAGMLRGGQARKQMRIAATQDAMRKGRSEISKLSEKEKLLIGAALYWAEGSKQKEYLVSTPVCFNNSDPRMVRLFLQWLLECAHLSLDAVRCDIYLHHSHRHRIEEVRLFWIQKIGFPGMYPMRIYFKKGNIKTQRHNTGNSYYGLIRITVLRSTQLNRIISGWIDGICEHWGVV